METNFFFSWREDTLEPVQGSVVQEFPLQLIVNGREIATLIGSPHELRFLVAGFLRLQGFVSSINDFKMFSVCEEFGAANIQISGELPERLKPVLTSGCGTGITFTIPSAAPQTDRTGIVRYQAAWIFGLMDELARRADNYRTHGGIHSAAVGHYAELLLYAEDLGRHNTLDRIAGEAMFKNMDLSGAMLVTSGRVSTEMVAKAALLGIRLIASRTSPTDMAVKLCRQSNICLVGYLRGAKFTVYSHPEMIDTSPDSTRIDGVTGVILAGGASRRMGCNKALLKIGDTTLIETVYRTMAALFHDVVIVTNAPEEYAFLPCRTVRDTYRDVGAMGGLHAGLAASFSPRVFVVGCDMPYLSPVLIRQLCAMVQSGDALVPVNAEGMREPLHALYDVRVIDRTRQLIESGHQSILDLLDALDTTLVPLSAFAAIDGAAASCTNINTPEEYDRLL